MTQHQHAVADQGRGEHRMSTDLHDLKQTSPPRFKSDKPTHGAFQNHERDIWTSSRDDQCRRDSTTWNTMGGQTVESSRPLNGVRAMRGFLRHPVSGIYDADLHRRVRRHPACTATTGATRDEEQAQQCCEFSGGPMGARQSLTERQPGNPVEESAELLGSSTNRDPEGRQRRDVLRTMRDVWNSVAARSRVHCGTGSRSDSEQSHRRLRLQGSDQSRWNAPFVHIDTEA